MQARESDPRKFSTEQPEIVGWTLPGLEDRSVIVTGAGSGIGAATARALAAAGSRVLAVDRDQAGLEATMAVHDGGNLEIIHADLTAPDAPQRVVEAALDAFGELTTIINVAGVMRPAFIPEITSEQLDFHMEINVYAPFRLVQHALSHLEPNRSQLVFCASSISAYRGSPGAFAYDVSKHAVLGMMRALTTELAPQGIRVNSFSPGTTVSPINDLLFSMPGWLDSVIARNPDGRIAEPHEHVGAVAYLISDLAKHVQGQDIAIDGGRLVN